MTTKLKEYDLYKLYDSMLDEIYGVVKIGPYEYTASRALKEVDPIAYRCTFADWLDSEIENGVIDEIDNEYFESIFINP